MAYVAAKSLKHTIQHLQKTPHISLVQSSANIIEFAYQQVDSLEAALKSERVTTALDVQIRETVYTFEDELESIVANQILSQSNGEASPLSFSIDLQVLQEETNSFVETLKKMEKEYVKESDMPLPDEDEDDDDDVVSATIDGQRSKMVGSSDQLKMVKEELVNMEPWTAGISYYEGVEVQVTALVGTAGIGKTTLAREVFEDPEILSHFDCRVWVPLHRTCLLKDIPRLILAQVNPDSDKMVVKRHRDVVRSLKASLKGRRFLIVLDDVWDKNIYCFDLVKFLPEYENGSRVLLTTRLQYVAKHSHCSITMRFLNSDESWDLLRAKVFGEELCPLQFEKAGKKIAKNCDGLPLTIVTVADLLSKAAKTPEFWSEVAAKKKHQLYIDAYAITSKVLYPSYKYLHQYLKIFFLRVGVFPQNFEIPRSKLMNMWSVEEFLDPHTPDPPKVTAASYLEELVSVILLWSIKRAHLISWAIKRLAASILPFGTCAREKLKRSNFFISWIILEMVWHKA